MTLKKIIFTVCTLTIVIVAKIYRAHGPATRSHGTLRHEKKYNNQLPLAEVRPLSSTAQRFHGLYLCQVGSPCPSYSASFLTSRQQLLSKPVTESHMQKKNANMEMASYFVMGRRGKNDVWRTIDALDFTVEHLSMYERTLRLLRRRNGHETKSIIADNLYAIFLERLRHYEQRLRLKCGGDDHSHHSKQTKGYARRTLGIMPYYAAGSGSGHTLSESKALYLNITIRSIRCHFAAVAVSCLDRVDYEYLTRGVGVPHIDHVIWVDPEKDLIVNKPPFLGISTVRAVQQRWTNKSSDWTQKYDFLYYTEADQVLHLRPRHRDKLFAPLLSINPEHNDTSTKMGVLTPHRLHAVPRSSDYEELLRAFLDPSAVSLRKSRFNIQDYEPSKDPYFSKLHKESIHKGGMITRELEDYEAKRLTNVDDDLNYGSCCYLRRNETVYPYDERGKPGGVRLDDSKAGDFGEFEDRRSPIEILTIGNHGVGVLSGLCCHFCARRFRLGRHCDDFCVPALPGKENCAVGAYADPLPSGAV